MHVFLIVAQSLDGYIAQSPHQVSTDWTTPEDKKFFRDRTKEAGVLIMGRTTFETIGRGLPGRKIFVLSSQPRPSQFSNLDESEVEFSLLSPEKLLAELEQSGQAEVAICGGAQIYTHFLKAGLIDTVYSTIEPVIFGTGVTIFTEDVVVKLVLKNVTKLSQSTLLTEYSVQKE